jgi:hypothetical protein
VRVILNQEVPLLGAARFAVRDYSFGL